ncbi:hypothetical protein [Asticcacaulis excentricus]|uniref:Uncharacterized protein n=1 Tax=Asticcacaulis excentricus (strain ATCC 15261 / DSM 4724 / KCTC 12464 / NCIMB 9791 / VKM B-1370 / CB 48) TaxID=573065 RepID=E8RPM3_ASTEC|nr:hypothetical protein [Asticcacaulis excentricus]ADU12000.1 hypothetical protein Astex_0302 [Asticcacaulis excentricus CB 48]
MTRVRGPSEIAVRPTSVVSGYTRTCQVCGGPYASSVEAAKFCGRACRSAFDNRIKARGVILYHLFMTLRYDRKLAKKIGLWSLICRAVAHWHAEDEAERNGRASYSPPEVVIQKTPHLFSAVVVKRRAK